MSLQEQAAGILRSRTRPYSWLYPSYRLTAQKALVLLGKASLYQLAAVFYLLTAPCLLVYYKSAGRLRSGILWERLPAIMLPLPTALASLMLWSPARALLTLAATGVRAGFILKKHQWSSEELLDCRQQLNERLAELQKQRGIIEAQKQYIRKLRGRS